MRVIITAILLLGLSGAMGCTTPKLMIQKSFIDSSKSITYLMQLTGSVTQGKKQVALYSYSIEICDLQPDGSELSCVDSPILENVRLSPHYR